MSELGIELVKPGGPSPGAAGTKAIGANLPKAQPGASPPKGQPAKPARPAGQSAVERLASGGHVALPPGLWGRLKPYSIELGLAPVVFLGMLLVQGRRGRSKADAFMIPTVGVLPPAEMEPFDMKNAVHSLGSEDFEMLVALIYQRQGYRVSMPAGVSGGRGGDFTLLRKSEKVLVQCKRLSPEYRVPVERVRELQEAMAAAGATRGLYVASCGFTWDARNFAKANNVTLINARTLDELINAAREQPDEDLLAVSQWVPKLLHKLQLTPPHCPSCKAPMEQLNVSAGAVWLCSQRPDCRGRRSARKYQKPAPAEARKTELTAETVSA